MDLTVGEVVGALTHERGAWEDPGSASPAEGPRRDCRGGSVDHRPSCLPGEEGRCESNALDRRIIYNIGRAPHAAPAHSFWEVLPMTEHRTLGTIGERANIVLPKKAPDLTERKDEPWTPIVEEVQPRLMRSQVRSHMPRGWWDKRKPLLAQFVAGKCTAEQVLDVAQSETGFRPTIAALGTAVSNLKKSLARTLVPHQGISVTPEQVRRAHEMVQKIATDVFDFQQETIRALNEVAEYIAILEQKP